MVGQRRVLHGASSGRDVRLVQEGLAQLRYALGQIDGVYGRRTEQAVREFQKQAGLPDDGVVGRQTIAALVESTGNSALANVRGPLHSSTTGRDVEDLQARLRALGHPVQVDGVFGPSTERAVMAVQKAAGIRDDGVVGPRTYAALDSATPVEPPPAQNVAPPRVKGASRPATPAAGDLTSDARDLLGLAGLVHETGSPWAVDVVRAAAVMSDRTYEMADGAIVARFGAVAGRTFGQIPLRSFASEPPGWLTSGAAGVRDAVERDPTEPADVRHLLAAAVAGDGARYVDAALRRQGEPADTLRRVLFDAILATRPDDDADAWAAVLDVPLPSLDGAALSGGYATDHVPADPSEPLTDLLDVDVYVRMLALLMANPDTRMPLSIGLFGEWGSGKSYFMRLLRAEIERLAASAPAAQDIVHITFNAWHYSDANLWASLADEIFEQLAGPSAQSGADDERRERIRQDLAATMRRRTELKQQTEAAAAEVADLRRQLEVAEAERDTSRRAFVAQVLQDDAVRKPLDQAARALGLGDTERARFRELAAEAGGARTDARLAWRYVTGRRWSVAAVFVTAFVALLTAAPFVADELRQWVGTGAAASVAAATATATTGLARARTGLAKLREAAAAADRIAAAAPTEEHAKLRQAEARLDTLTVQLEEVVTRVGDLGRELAELSAGHRLYRFIAERAASDDYRRHLGIVSAIRRDFERLVELMKQWRAERDAAAPDGERPPRPVDRIVLYIDDLDRCSAEQVVDVLQAVHLLLAMDLFVVVVGVDPRWLLRALRGQYAGILDADRDAGTWSSTPQDYLEKIFNIPFALPGMTPDAYTSLLTGLATRPEAVDRAGPATATAVPGGEAPADDAADDAAAGTAAGATDEPLLAEAGSEVATAFDAAAPTEARPMTDVELAYLAKLAPLIRTPRSATRMFNVYRMLRSTKDLTAAGAFLRADGGGEYRVVAQLLAVLTAYPQVLGPLLFARPADGTEGGVVHRPEGASWRQFVAGLAVADGRNAVVSGIAPADAAAWNEVAGCLTAWAADVGPDDVEPFRRWARHVARFSFQPGAVAR